MILAAVTKDIRFYKWPNISYLDIYETPSDTSVRSISWSCDGQNVIAVKNKGNPIIVHAPDKKVGLQYSECNIVQFVSHAVFSNIDPCVVALGTDEGSVYVYDVRNTERPQGYAKLSAGVQCIDFSHGDHFIAVGSRSGSVVLYDTSYKPRATFSVPNLLNVVYYKYSKNLLATSARPSIVSVWNADTSDNLFTTQHHDKLITDIAFFENGISSVGLDKKFVTYDLRCTEASCWIMDSSLSSLAYANGTNEIAISTVSGQIRNYDFRNMKVPLITFVANKPIRKIAFPFGGRHSSSNKDNDASGDFSCTTDSSPRRSLNNEEGVVVCDSAPSIPPNHSEDYSLLMQFVEEKIEEATKKMETKIVDTFYNLRIDTSKKFINLEEKLTNSWNSFMEYLKFSGQEFASSGNVDSLGKVAILNDKMMALYQDKPSETGSQERPEETSSQDRPRETSSQQSRETRNQGRPRESGNQENSKEMRNLYTR